MSKVLMVIIGVIVVLAVVGFAMRDKPDLSPKTVVRASASPPKTTTVPSSFPTTTSSSQPLTYFAGLHALTSGSNSQSSQVAQFSASLYKK